MNPIDDHVFLEQDEAVTKIDNIELPKGSEKRPITGTVIAAGPGRICEGTGERIPLTVRVGDRVMWKPYAGDNVTRPSLENTGEETYFVLREKDLLCIIEEDEQFHLQTHDPE